MEDISRLKAEIAQEQDRLAAQERAKMEADLMAHVKGAAGGGGGGGGAAAAAADGGGGDEDALDAFMSGVETQMEKDKVGVVWCFRGFIVVLWGVREGCGMCRSTYGPVGNANIYVPSSAQAKTGTARLVVLLFIHLPGSPFVTPPNLTPFPCNLSVPCYPSLDLWSVS